MIKRIFLAVVLFSFFFPVKISFAESGLFEKAKEKFSEAENFAVAFSSPSGKIKGTAIYSRKFGEKIEFGDYTIVVKNDTVFNYNAKVNRLVISLREEEYSNFSLAAVLFELPERCEITEEKNAVLFIPRNPDEENFSSLKVIFGKDELPSEIIITDLNGNENAFVLSDYKFNVNTGAKDFEISTDKNTKIIDLR